MFAIALRLTLKWIVNYALMMLYAIAAPSKMRKIQPVQNQYLYYRLSKGDQNA